MTPMKTERKLRLALIAHDNKKPDLVALAKEYGALLTHPLVSITATGTTGARIEESLRVYTNVVNTWSVHRMLSGPLG